MARPAQQTQNTKSPFSLPKTKENTKPTTMKPKQKHQSSLLAFFGKPKAAAAVGSASTAEARKDQTSIDKRDDINKDDDGVNDAIIEPSSPQLNAKSEEKLCNTIVVSPQAIEATDETVSAPTISVAEDDASSQKSASESESDEDSVSDKKSAYELLREQNIARNNARLKSLGLLSDIVSQKQIAKKKTVKRKKAAGNADVISYPTRRSTRRRKAVLGDDEGAGGINSATMKEDVLINEESFKQEEIESEQFTVSPLFEYNMTTVNQFSKFAYKSGKDDNSVGSSKSLVPFGPRLIPPSGLNAIYSLQFYRGFEGGEGNSDGVPSWLAGAGKSGIVALWDCRRQSTESHEGIDPIVSWKAHGGRWVADARFLTKSSSSINNNSTNDAPTQLLTAANDGTICHWDLTSTSVTTGAPKLLDQTNKSLHASGIFSMDISVDGTTGVIIATGSKDKTIALSNVDKFGDAYWRSDFHSAKVGCVCLSSSNANLIASASDDGLVAVHDSRLSTAALKIAGAHFKPHSAIWQPGSDFIFLTAGLDDVIKLWDSRDVSRPLASFHGHVPGHGKKIKRIHRPAFLTLPGPAGSASESFILSGGECSHSVSMFAFDKIRHDGSLQSVFNRGKLPDDTGDIGSLAVQNGYAAIAMEGGEVLLLSPIS
jgi:WD40 repeat protein